MHIFNQPVHLNKLSNIFLMSNFQPVSPWFPPSAWCWPDSPRCCHWCSQCWPSAHPPLHWGEAPPSQPQAPPSPAGPSSWRPSLYAWSAPLVAVRHNTVQVSDWRMWRNSKPTKLNRNIMLMCWVMYYYLNINCGCVVRFSFQQEAAPEQVDGIDVVDVRVIILLTFCNRLITTSHSYINMATYCCSFTLRRRFMSASMLEMVILCMMTSEIRRSRDCHLLRATLVK